GSELPQRGALFFLIDFPGVKVGIQSLSAGLAVPAIGEERIAVGLDPILNGPTPAVQRLPRVVHGHRSVLYRLQLRQFFRKTASVLLMAVNICLETLETLPCLPLFKAKVVKVPILIPRAKIRGGADDHARNQRKHYPNCPAPVGFDLNIGIRQLEWIPRVGG